MLTLGELHVELERRLNRAGLGRIAESLKPLLLPSLRLRLGEHSADAVTRLGGLPNLSAVHAWPTRRDGSPHAFLAQFDLAALPPLESLPLPSSGTLFFFADAEFMPTGFDPGDNDSYAVIYSPEPIQDHPLRESPLQLKQEFVFKGYSLVPELELTAPEDLSDILPNLTLTNAEFESYIAFFDPQGSATRLGGHADQVQAGLYLEAELVSHGIYCGGPAGYEEGRRRGLGAGASEWLLLFQVDSEEQCGMMWHDAGRIYFLIRKHDIGAARFERVHAALQCG